MQKTFTHQLKLMCVYCFLTPGFCNKYFYTLHHPQPLFLVTEIRLLPFTNPTTRFSYMSSASGASKPNPEL